MLQLNARPIGQASSTSTVGNKLLQPLTPYEFSQLKPYLRRVNLEKHSVIHEEGSSVQAVYFIEGGVLSRTAKTRSDAPVEIAMVGKSGLVGLSVILGTSVAIHRTVVLINGVALRIAAEDLREVMTRVPSVRETLLRYAQLLMSQNGQVSFCNARHALESRLSRWLLSAHDHLNDDTLQVTNEVVANLLGVRRPGVSATLKSLHQAGIVQKGRGALKIKQRDLLQQRACRCYSIIDQNSFWRRMPVLHHHVFEEE